MVDAASAQAIQAFAQDRSRELQEAAFERTLGQPAREMAHQPLEFLDRIDVARAVAAHHDSDSGHRCPFIVAGAALDSNPRRPAPEANAGGPAGCCS